MVDREPRWADLRMIGVALSIVMAVALVACGDDAPPAQPAEGDERAASDGQALADVSGPTAPRHEARTLGDPLAPVTIEEWGDFQ